MKKYEIGFILRPNLDQETTESTVETLKNIYADGVIVDELQIGVRELAYPIEKHNTGFYFFFVAEATHEMNKEFERICKINENVIRHMIIDVTNIKASTLDTLRK